MNEEELNKKWNLHNVVDEAVRGALNYDNSSRESAVRIAELQTNQNNIMDKLEEFHIDNKEQHELIIRAIENLEKKFASKWVEKVFVWFLSILGVGFLTYLGALIIKLIEIKR